MKSSTLAILYLAVLFFCVAASSHDEGLKIHWKDNILTISGKNMPGEKMDILYLDAFCKTGSTLSAAFSPAEVNISW